jgi:hypothetical protein
MNLLAVLSIPTGALLLSVGAALVVLLVADLATAPRFPAQGPPAEGPAGKRTHAGPRG